MIDEHDQHTRRCPMLGHELSFGYCRRPGRDLPCGRIYDCWWERFDIVQFMQTHYTPEQIEAALRPRQPKLRSLVEIIEEARKRAPLPPSDGG